MESTDTAQKWASAVNRLTLGATAAEGGTRTKTVTVGGSKCLPWLAFEGEVGCRPAIAFEIWDSGAGDWPAELRAQFGDAINDPVAWAKKGEEAGADLICLKLVGTHPEMGNRDADDSVKVVKSLLAEVGLPLIILGCGIDEKDNEILPKCSEAAKGENCLVGNIRQKNYRTLVAASLADGHKLLAESPLDINIAKQVNILAHDIGYPLENLVIFPTTAAMGYGFEYVYSIMERGRLAGLGGDPLLRQPVLCDVGVEAWRTKEAQASEAELPGHGPASERGSLWETITATNYLQAGADILVLRHPLAIAQVKEAIESLCGAAK